MVSPTATSMGRHFPSSVRKPGPIATTSPSFSCLPF
jgi:hypothetical protein